MIWGSPFALLLLLAALPLILFLHSLRPRKFQLRTTTLFLWERVMKERPAGRRLGRLLRNNLLLLLQLLIALLLIAGLADPLLLRYGVPLGDTIAVIDLSASMKARGSGGSRFEAARREFLSLVDALPSGQKMMVIGAGPHPRILSPLTADKRRLKDLGQALAPTDAACQVKEAILLAHSFLKPGSRDRVVVFSDGAFEGVEELPWRSAHLRLIRAQGGEDNVGITAFEVRRHPTDGSYEILIHVRNFTRRTIRAPLSLTMGEKRLAEENLTIGPEQSRTLIYPYRGALAGRATAALGVADDFLTDNRAFLALSESAPLRLLYAGKGNPFLERLFASFPQVRVTRRDRLTPESLSATLGEYDVIVLDGIPFPPVTQGNFILINTMGKGLPLGVEGKLLRPRPLVPERRHALMEGVRLDELYVREALRLIPRGEGTTLVRSREGPLIFALERGRLKSLIFGFDLSASDLPYRVAFPLLFSNAFDWFRPSRAEFPATQVKAGLPYLLYLPASDDLVEVRSPSGKRERLSLTSTPFPFGETLEAGFYTYRTRDREGEFAVNLLSESESEIRTPLSAAAAAPAETTDGQRTETQSPLWPFLVILALLLLAAEAYLAWRNGLSFYPLAIRALAFLALVFALANPRIFMPAKALDVVLAVDFSRSVGQEGKELAARILRAARAIKGPDSRTGLFFFGRRPVWEFFPRAEIRQADFSPSVDREETDLQAALEAALAQIGEGRQGKILLVSDGNENRGEAARLLPLLRSLGIGIWTFPVGSPPGKNEIYLKELLLPPQVDSAEGFEVKGEIESLTQAPARVKLLRDGVVQREMEIRLVAGNNWVGFKQSLTARGSHTFELLVESGEDTLAENNRLQGVVRVKGPPLVLYLSSQEKGQRFFSRVLSVQGYSVVESSPEQRSLSLSELSGFDLVVLDNLPAYRLSQAKMEALEQYVRDLGGGLIVIGGSQSYGAGGYYRTPLERLLPVEMRPPARLDLPHVALLFVLDKSGSMGAGPQGATKLDLAKAAAMAAADLLNPSDQVGILAFDAGWVWALAFRQVGKGELISEKLSSLQSDGGTDLYKAMVEADRSFSAKEAAIRHLLVLSDGLTDKADFTSLVRKMVHEGTTISTVALGRDADIGLMREIAEEGKGRAYVTLDPQSIPHIFTTETLLISRDLLVEKTVYPRATTAAGPLKGLSQQRLPPVRGYVLTHPKPRADLLIRAAEDPLLVSWRYGLGSVAAFTSDLSGRWGKEWVGWEGFPQWAGQLARATMRRVADDRVRTELRQEGEEIKVAVDFLSQKGSFVNHLKLKGNLTGPEPAARISPFRQTAPGRYESSFRASERGVYLFTISEEREGGERSVAATVPFVAPYPREYRELRPNIRLLGRLAEATGGELLDPGKMDEGLRRVFTADPGKATSSQQTWWALCGLGLLLFLADLTLRRLPALFHRQVPIESA